MKAKNKKLYTAAWILWAAALILLWGGQAGAAEGPFVSDPVTPHVFDQDLRELPTAQAWQPGNPEREVPLVEGPGSPSQGIPGLQTPTDLQPTDPAGQDAMSPFLMPAPSQNFDGIPSTGYTPPDTQGDVGPNHYIQVVNVSFAIWNKKRHTTGCTD